jgi:glycosyltransferase involved in cell wall biosynthesis
MKVLLFSHLFPPSVGGVERYVWLLANALARSGEADVTVATRTPAPPEEDQGLGFRVVRRPSLLTLWRLAAEADIVQLAGPVMTPMLVGWIQQKALVVEHHAYQACCPNGLLLHEPDKSPCPGHFQARHYASCLRCNASSEGAVAGASRFLLTFPRRWLAARADTNVGVSDHARARNGLPQGRTIYHGIPESPPAEAAPTAPPVFAYVGRLVSEKGLPLLLRAASTLRDEGRELRVRFIGDGPERSMLEGMARSLGLGEIVAFTGFLAGERLAASCADATAVVMPSVWEESAGLAAIEQMMRGRLVIAADIGGLGEIVAAEGLKFRPGDAGDLAAAMRRVLDRPGIAGELGARARARALKVFRDDRMAEDHLRLYRELLERRARGGNRAAPRGEAPTGGGESRPASTASPPRPGG